MSARYYAIQEFFGGYLHEDWDLEGSTTIDVARRFHREADPKDVAAVLAELDLLVREPLSEEELHSRMLTDYSLYYDPWKDELTMREWLTQVRAVLASRDGMSTVDQMPC